jgi:hypothetical protein
MEGRRRRKNGWEGKEGRTYRRGEGRKKEEGETYIRFLSESFASSEVSPCLRFDLRAFTSASTPPISSFSF